MIKKTMILRSSVELNNRFVNSGIIMGLLAGFLGTFPAILSNITMENEVFIAMASFPFLAPLLSGYFRDFFWCSKCGD